MVDSARAQVHMCTECQASPRALSDILRDRFFSQDDLICAVALVGWAIAHPTGTAGWLWRRFRLRVGWLPLTHQLSLLCVHAQHGQLMCVAYSS
eukprot:2786183-Pyramimonas_sp.AAC.1